MCDPSRRELSLNSLGSCQKAAVAPEYRLQHSHQLVVLLELLLSNAIGFRLVVLDAGPAFAFGCQGVGGLIGLALEGCSFKALVVALKTFTRMVGTASRGCGSGGCGYTRGHSWSARAVFGE